MNLETKIRNFHLPQSINTVLQFAYSAIRAIPPGKAKSSGDWDSVSNHEFERIVNRLSNLNDPERHNIRNILAAYDVQSILDVGCGPATENASFRSNNRLERVRYTGLDESQRMLSLAKDRVSTTSSLVRGDVHALPFSDNAFDAVLLKHILEHQPDGYERSLSEAIRLAKKLVIVNFFHTLLGLAFPDIRLNDRRNFANNWYGRKKFENFLVTRPKVDGFEILQCPGIAGQIADIYTIHLKY